MTKKPPKIKKAFLTILCLLIFFFSTLAFSSQADNLTIEWLFDGEIQGKFRTPHYAWLSDSRALILDVRQKKEELCLELLNPETGKRMPAFDRSVVLSSFKELLDEKAPSAITWPDAIDPNGRALIYTIDDDLFCIDLEDSSVKRLTETASSEESPDFSPDGKWVGFIRDNDIYVIDWREGIENRLTTGATDSLLNGPFSYLYRGEIYQRTPVPYLWSPDSRAVAYLQTDESMVSISTFVHFKPQTQAVVKQRYPKAGQTNPKVRLGIVELATAQTTWMDCGEYEYLSRFKWLPGGQEIAVQTQDRKQQEMRLLLAERRSGKSREILVETHPCWVNLGPSSSLHFIQEGTQFIWLSERDDYQHAYLLSIDGNLIRQLTKGDFMISSATLVSRSGGLLGVDEKESRLYFMSNKKALNERHLYCVGLDGSGLQRISQGNGFHSIRFSPCMSYYMDEFSSTSIPPSLTLCKANGVKIREIAAPELKLVENLGISYPTFHAFKADDGLELAAMMTKPLDFDPEKKYPAIIYVYGGPGAQQVVDTWGNRGLWHSLLAQEGFFVFVFDVRAGVGKSHATETSVYKRAYGMQNVKDILSGVEWIKKMPSVDPERLGLWGSSGGGCTTLYTMTHCDAFKAGISRVPVSDWYFYDSFYTERYMSTPQDNPDGYEETSSVLAASKLNARLLIIDGTYDDNVHIQNTWAFIDELIKNNIQFEMMIYPWRKHGISDQAARIHMHTLMLDFWKRNLK